VDAFALDAVNYLMKPITPRALEETAARLRKNLAPRPAENRALCFGEFEVFSRRSGEPIRWPTAKAKELFACLICGRGRQAEKWRLCEALWPDSPPRKVENRLYSTVNRVKTALKSAEIPPSVFCDKGKYSLGAENFSCDFWEADSFFRAASGINDGNVAECEKILALRRGVLFEGEDFLWADMKNKRYEKADFHLRAVLALDPTDEESVAMLMGACFFQRKKRALQQVYAAYCGRLYEEQGEKPAPEVEKLFRSFLQYL
jgi:two-component SAPR family response regulator